MRSSILAPLALLLSVSTLQAQRLAPAAVQSPVAQHALTPFAPSPAAGFAEPGRGGRVLKYTLRGALFGAGVAGIVSLLSNAKGSDCVAGARCDKASSTGSNIALGAGIGAVVGAVAGFTKR